MGKSYQPKRWGKRQLDILKLWMRGWRRKDIAEKLGVSEQYVSMVVHSDAGKELLKKAAIDDMREIAKKRISRLLPRAVDVLEELLSDPQSSIKLKAATGLLDRGGLAPAPPQQDMGGFLTADDIEAIKKRALLERAREEAQEAEIVQDRLLTSEGAQ